MKSEPEIIGLQVTGGRPDRRAIHMATAMMWAARSLCIRPNSQCGSVITSSDLRRIVAIGYNGPARGLPENSCTGLVGACGCLHAEDNAIASIRGWEVDLVLFTTKAPCSQCAQRIIQAGIETIYFKEHYRDNKGLDLLSKCNVDVFQL